MNKMTCPIDVMQEYVNLHNTCHKSLAQNKVKSEIKNCLASMIKGQKIIRDLFDEKLNKLLADLTNIDPRLCFKMLKCIDPCPNQKEALHKIAAILEEKKFASKAKKARLLAEFPGEKEINFKDKEREKGVDQNDNDIRIMNSVSSVAIPQWLQNNIRLELVIVAMQFLNREEKEIFTNKNIAMSSLQKILNKLIPIALQLDPIDSEQTSSLKLAAKNNEKYVYAENNKGYACDDKIKKDTEKLIAETIFKLLISKEICVQIPLAEDSTKTEEVIQIPRFHSITDDWYEFRLKYSKTIQLRVWAVLENHALNPITDADTYIETFVRSVRNAIADEI